MQATTRMNGGTDLAIRSASELAPRFSMQEATDRRNAMVEFVQKIMVPNVDFGIVPGTEKNTLLKPGAEKLITFFGLAPQFELVRFVEDWTGDQHGGESLFYYVYRCTLFQAHEVVANSEASCNSRDPKYRWRWVKEDEIPAGMDKAKLRKRSGAIKEPDFAIDRGETTGKYGKPEAYWQRFREAITNGTARKFELAKRDKPGKVVWIEIGETMYRVPNEDIAGQINTLQKMAQKRALVGTTLLAVNASEFFTQDVEDMEPIDGGSHHPSPDAPPVTEPEFKMTTDGEPDLTHDNTFHAEWDRAVIAQSIRGMTKDISRNFLEMAMVNAGEKGKGSVWRSGLIQSVAKGEQNKRLEAKVASSQSAPIKVDAKVVPPVQSEPKIDTRDTQADPISIAPEDINTPDKFMAEMCEIPAISAKYGVEEVRTAVNRNLSVIKKTIDTAPPAALWRIYVAAKEGRFAIPGGQIRPPQPVKSDDDNPGF